MPGPNLANDAMTLIRHEAVASVWRKAPHVILRAVMVAATRTCHARPIRLAFHLPAFRVAPLRPSRPKALPPLLKPLQ